MEGNQQCLDNAQSRDAQTSREGANCATSTGYECSATEPLTTPYVSTPGRPAHYLTALNPRYLADYAPVTIDDSGVMVTQPE